MTGKSFALLTILVSGTLFFISMLVPWLCRLPKP